MRRRGEKEIERLARVVKKPPQRRAAAVTMAPIAPMVAIVLMADGGNGAEGTGDAGGDSTRTAQAKLQHRQIRR
jgi:hypothetical protein